VPKQYSDLDTDVSVVAGNVRTVAHDPRFQHLRERLVLVSLQTQDPKNCRGPWHITTLRGSYLFFCSTWCL